MVIWGMLILKDAGKNKAGYSNDECDNDDDGNDNDHSQCDKVYVQVLKKKFFLK